MLDLTDDPLAAGLSNLAVGRRDRLAVGSMLSHRPTSGLQLVAAPPPQEPRAKAARRRTRIWELNPSFHCSIVGTCLSTAELRQVLSKFDIGNVQALSDHDLHKNGVTLAGQSDGSAKLLQKALDRRHERVIHQFDKAKVETEVARLWDEATQRGEIPGAYWAVLTHPLTGDALMKRVFGETHMLSHLVGAANRADIRRLRDLEVENAGLRAKVERQQEQIRECVVSRDAKIRELDALLARAVANTIYAPEGSDDAEAGLSALVANLERRLSSETAHRQRIEDRLKVAEDRLNAERAARAQLGQSEQSLKRELEIVESALASQATEAPENQGTLQGRAVLYVGGKTGHVAELREIAGRFSATLLHHDGGIEDSGARLAGSISQAEIVFFPVDCISHDAMHMIKRLSQQAGKPYIPLRSAGLTSFLAALRAVGASISEKQADPGF